MRSAILLAASFLSAASSLYPANAQPLRTVALSGTPVTGLGSGADLTFTGFGVPSINAAGEVLYTGVFEGEGVTEDNQSGLWIDHGGSTTHILRNGDPVPGMPEGTTFNSWGVPLLNDAGDVAFFSFVKGDALPRGEIDRAIFVYRSGALEVVAGPLTPAAGGAGGELFGLQNINPSFNARGDVSFTGFALNEDRSSVFRGLWASSAGALELRVKESIVPPEEGEPSILLGISSALRHLEYLQWNDAGQLAFLAEYRDIDEDERQGVWLSGPDSLRLVADGVGRPSLNNAGQVAFAGSPLETNGERSPWSIWIDAAGETEAVVQDGDPAPGLPEEVTFRSLGAPVLNGQGTVVFPAQAQGYTGIWTGDPESLSLVAYQGQPAPGTPEGVVFSRFDELSLLSPFPFGNKLMINANGQVAFAALLEGGAGQDEDRGIWATDRTGDLRLIARVGDLLEVASGDYRTVSDLRYGPLGGSGGEDGRISALNDRGQLTFWAGFDDGSSGVFVSNIVAVPEPVLLTPFALLFSALPRPGRRLSVQHTER